MPALRIETPDTFRRTLLATALAAASLLAPAGAFAQSSAPVRLLIGFPAGSAVDIVARILAEQMQGEMKQSFVVESRPGAAGRIAVDAVKNAKPDGTTLLVAPHGPLTLFPYVFPNLTYNPERDFVPVAQLTTFEFGLFAAPGVAAKDLAELKTWAAANPSLASYGSPGMGTTPHFVAMALSHKAGIGMTHIPFNSPPQIMTSMVGGQLSMAMLTIQEGLEFTKSGKIKLLGTSGATRSAQTPAVPTFKEQGVDVQLTGWFGVFAPAGTPASVVSAYERAAIKAMNNPDIKARLAAISLTATGAGGAELGRIRKAESEYWAGIVKATGFTPEK